MTILTPHIAAQLFDTPLMVAPDKIVAMLTGLGGRVVEGGVVLLNGPAGVDHTPFAQGRPSMGVIGDGMGAAMDARRVRGYGVVSDVAVIAAEGSLVQKGAYIGKSSGQTSYQGLQVQLARAWRDRKGLKGAVVEVDSYGGQVSGAFETAEMLAELSRAMPTMAILTDAAASAAYLLASQCRQIVMPDSGVAGSIGAISLHADWSGHLEKEGVKVTLIAAGEHKADGNPFEPLGEEVHNTLCARNEAVRQKFATVVAKGRGGRMSRAKALATEARAYYGADALEAGLVDAIAPAQAAFSAFVKAVNPAV